jgi:formate hydrogenlyase subunit 4
VWASHLKQIVLFALITALFFPFGLASAPAEVLIAFGAFLLKLVALGFVMSLVESSSAKLRILRVPELLGAASALAMLALVAEVVIR